MKNDSRYGLWSVFLKANEYFVSVDHEWNIYFVKLIEFMDEIKKTPSTV